MAKKETEEKEFAGSNLMRYGATVVPEGWYPLDNVPALVKYSRSMSEKEQKTYRIWVKWRSEIISA
jgi:hypothetical protein